jgi:uncharacterized protein
MKQQHIFLLIFIAGVIGVLFYSLQGDLSPEEYAAMIAKEREAKDIYMRTAEDSPFAGQVEPFTGLKYYEPNMAYRIRAKITRIHNGNNIELASSSGEVSKYMAYAYADFSIDNDPQRLLILEAVTGSAKGTLFLGFADATSAVTTYGAGRYLDLKKVSAQTSIWLDFNTAYNPYCAYVDNFSCPLPPRENILDVSIEAGEKTYH